MFLLSSIELLLAKTKYYSSFKNLKKMKAIRATESTWELYPRISLEGSLGFNPRNGGVGVKTPAAGWGGGSFLA